MAGEFQSLQGMADIHAPEIHMWQALEQKARAVFSHYGYEELRTPHLEKKEIFLRSIGKTTDVVQKEMYVFEDRGGRTVALRPEGTAGAVRHLAGRGEGALGARVYYIGPMFRCERPQAGRKRQFHQIGAEATSEPNPLADAESIALQHQLLEAWGVKGIGTRISTRGSSTDREAVAAGLRSALEPNLEALCEDCRRRIGENVLRVIDCKNEACKAIVEQIPTPLECMSKTSRAYLDAVSGALNALGIEAVVDSRLVRGLDYYAHTVWEITHDKLGAQNALAGGGRYEIAWGKKTVSGVGFAMGVERVITALEASGVQSGGFQPRGGIWLVSLGEAALTENMKLARELRRRGIRCGMGLEATSVKAQLRKAGRFGAGKVIILGENEIANRSVVIKDLEQGVQETISLQDWLATV